MSENIEDPFDIFKCKLVQRTYLNLSYNIDEARDAINSLTQRIAVDMIIKTDVIPIVTRMPITNPLGDLMYLCKVDYFEKVKIKTDGEVLLELDNDSEAPTQCPECDSKDILVDSESDPDCIMWICKNCKEVIHSE